MNVKVYVCKYYCVLLCITFNYYPVPDLVSQRLSEELQQQEGLSAVGPVVKQTEHQHLHEGGGATLRHQEDQLSQVQRLRLLHTGTKRTEQF